MPITRFQSLQCADPPAASSRRHIHPPARRRHQIPIAPVAPPVPNFPRLRALALFGRRPPQHVEGVVVPASKNLHKSGSLQAYSITSSARRQSPACEHYNGYCPEHISLELSATRRWLKRWLAAVTKLRILT